MNDILVSLALQSSLTLKRQNHFEPLYLSYGGINGVES